jgi:hypothetical protein
MSYSSDLNERRRRSRRQDTRLLIYALRSLVATAALVAIAFAFDVPETIRASLWGPPPEASAQRPTGNPAPSRPPSQKREIVKLAAEEDAPNPFDDPPRRHPVSKEGFDLGNKPTALSGKDEVIIPGRPRQPVLEPRGKSPAAPAVDEDERFGQFFVLKLDKKRMRIPLAEAPAEGKPKPRVRVIALRKVEAQVELQPSDGKVGDGDLQIMFPEFPRARILIRVDKLGQRIFLIVEPQLALWADQPMPYMLNRIKSEAHKTRRAAEEFFAQLAAAEEERASLEAWIKPGTGIKPLANVQRANNRLAALKAIIDQMKGHADAVKQGVEQVDELEKLADLLHDHAELQIEMVAAD